ncbi:hypothetical protein U2I54_27920 [Bacillus pseudomycoides]|uniref:HPP family protein n=1 Tax=Bacillus bingmayongensis TaxID=1150157 RepID=A0ABU5K4S4_9BACI|nr:hypothetical protein [Bacillus pseudomycoides]
MVTTSVILDDTEFILPEIAAMGIAMWAYRDPNWLRDPLNICLAPTITAIIGFSANQLPFYYLGKIGFTLIIMMLFLRIIQSNFAPSLATGLLPLITNAQHWTIILLIFILTFILMLITIAFRLNKGLIRNRHIDPEYTIFFLFLIFLWMGICWFIGFGTLAIIPPIVVVVYESIQKPEYSGKIALKQAFALVISSSIGTLLYVILDSWIQVTILNMVLMLFLSRIINIRMPAIFAFPLLPFILPYEFVIKLPEATLFTCIFMFVSVTLYKKYDTLKRINNNKHAKHSEEITM